MAPRDTTIEERAFAYFLMHEIRELLNKWIQMRIGYVAEFTKFRWEMWQNMSPQEKKPWIDMVLEEMEEESPTSRRQRPSFLEPY